MQALRDRLGTLSLRTVLNQIDPLLRRIDPTPRPAPVSSTFLMYFGVGLVGTMFLLVTNKYLPGLDQPYHAHGSRVWIDAGRAGTAYAGYVPGDALDANVFMYIVAKFFSHFVGPFPAFRLVQSYYLLGVPLACLYALRALGRPLWGSLIAFPLCYTEVFAAGYANNAFAAPTFIFALVRYWRFTTAPTWPRGAIVAALFVAVFLSHAQVYLWLGALVITYTLVMLVVGLLSAGGGKRTLVLAGSALAAATPSLLVFARWYRRTYGSGHAIGVAGNANFQTGMSWSTLQQKLMGGALQAFGSTTNKYEVLYLLGLGLLMLFALSLARAGRDRSPPIFEIAVLLSIISAFALPDDVSGQMVAVRQWYVVFWLTPILIVPPPIRGTPVRSLAVVTATLGWAVWRMAVLTDHLRRFTKEEMIGFDQIVKAAPREPGLTLTYAAIEPRSQYWLTSAMYHTYGYLDSQRSYDGPVEYSDEKSVAPIRYKKGPPHPVKHIYYNANWASDPAIWEFDLVLVRRWVPTAAQEKTARERGTLIAAAGDWQLWRKNP